MGEEEKKNLRAHAEAFGTRYDFPIGLERVLDLPNLTRGLVARGPHRRGYPQHPRPKLSRTV